MAVLSLYLTPSSPIPHYRYRHLVLPSMLYHIFCYLIMVIEGKKVCVCVHTKGPFMLMEYISLLFLCFFLNLTTAIEPPPPQLYPPPQTTTTQCKLLECKWSMCASEWKEKDHQRKLQQVTPTPVQGVFAPMAEGKTPPVQVAIYIYRYICGFG